MSGLCKQSSSDSSSNIKNRLQSIIYDALFIQSVVCDPKFRFFPLIPNERCGLWYVPTFLHGALLLTSEASLTRTAAPLIETRVEPSSVSANASPTSYFKSTDGHINEWQFSLRRLNLHLLPVLAKYGGIVSVDSTRKGKRIPDSLLKTIPIWCAVLNCIMYENEPITEAGLYGSVVMEMQKNQWLWYPEAVVSRIEYLAIVDKIPKFVGDVKRLSLVSKELLLKALGGKRKPLVPVWVSPAKMAGDQKVEEVSKYLSSPYPENVYTITCVTASLCVRHGEAQMEIKSQTGITKWDYVQGSGDDHELWATKDICGGKLSPKIFWDSIYYSNHKVNEAIIDPKTGYIYNDMTEKELISQLEYFAQQSIINKVPEKLDVTYVHNDDHDTGICFGRISSNINYNDFISDFPKVTCLIILSDKYNFLDKPNKGNMTLKHFKIGSTKKASRQLRTEVIDDIITSRWCHNQDEQIMVLCETGTDISAGIVVMFLTYYFDIDWVPHHEGQTQDHFINKDLVKRHLSKLNELRSVNPSRNTLQSIHEFLMPFVEKEHKELHVFRIV